VEEEEEEEESSRRRRRRRRRRSRHLTKVPRAKKTLDGVADSICKALPGATSTRVKKMMWLTESTLTILVYMLGLQLWFVNRAMLPLMQGPADYTTARHVMGCRAW